MAAKRELQCDWHDGDFAQVFRCAPVGLCLVDRQSRYVRVNERLAELNGRTVDDHLGRTPADIQPDTAPLVQATLRAVLEGGEPLYEIESSITSPDRPGGKQWRLENWYPLRSAQGEVWGALGAVTEITERKRREELLFQAKAEAEAECIANQHFAARLSYEMRAPLTAILGFAELLADPQASPGQRQDYAEDIQRNAQSLLRLVNSILELGREEGRHLPSEARGRVSLHAAPRILLAEDTQDSQKLFKTILDKAGLLVDVAPDGITAFERALATLHANQPYGLILMDMQMPGLDGFEVTRRLRAAGWRKPIVALTGFATPEDRQRCLEAGCDEHLPKPVTRQVLLATIQNYLQFPGLHAWGTHDPPVPASPAPRTDGCLLDDVHLSEEERARLLEGFHESLPGYLEELTQAVRGQDREQLRQTAHRLAGVAGLYGFRALEQAAASLEHRATQAGWPELAGSVNGLRIVVPAERKPVAETVAAAPPAQVATQPVSVIDSEPRHAGEDATGRPVRVLLAEDDALVRVGVRAVLDALPNVQVVAVACNGREAVDQAQKYRPDIALMDITMPELDGLNATAQLAETCPQVRVIMLSVHTREDCVLQAMRVGARGYLLKSTPPEELERALQAVMRGEPYLCSGVSEHVVTAFLEQHGTRQSAAKRPTSRQLEILKLIAEGYSTKMIASELGISVKTADRHRSDLMKLLDIHETASLVRYAVRMGLVSAES